MPQVAWHTIPEPEHNYDSVLECNRFMLENEVACDITFILTSNDGTSERIRAHRYMLISRNPVFRAMFCGGMAESGEEVYIQDVQPLALSKIIRYLYCESIELTEEDAFDVLYAAKKYMINPLVSACIAFLRKHIAVDNVCTILNYATFYDEEDLQKQCLKLISAKTSEVLGSGDYLNLSKDAMGKILQLEILNIPEVAVVRMCISWTQEKSARNDEHYTPSLVKSYIGGDSFYMLRIPNLENDDFQALICGTGLLNQEDEDNIALFRNKKIDGRECKFQTIPRRFRESGFYTCLFASSHTSHAIMEYKKAKVHHLEVSEDIILHGLDVVDSPGSYLNGIHIAIEQRGQILFRTGLTVSAGRKATALGKVIPIHLPKQVRLLAGQFKIYLTFRAIGAKVGICVPASGPIDVNGTCFQITGTDSFHISSLRFSVD